MIPDRFTREGNIDQWVSLEIEHLRPVLTSEEFHELKLRSAETIFYVATMTRIVHDAVGPDRSLDKLSYDELSHVIVRTWPFIEQAFIAANNVDRLYLKGNDHRFPFSEYTNHLFEEVFSQVHQFAHQKRRNLSQ